MELHAPSVKAGALHSRGQREVEDANMEAGFAGVKVKVKVNGADVPLVPGPHGAFAHCHPPFWGRDTWRIQTWAVLRGLNSDKIMIAPIAERPETDPEGASCSQVGSL